MPRLILDTGPLLDLLLYRFWSEQGRSIDENRFICRKLFNVSPEQIAQFLGRHQNIIAVPGVFVEVARLARAEIVHSAGHGRAVSLAPFWSTTIRELQQMGVNEKWIQLLSLDPALLGEFGPTDAALIHCSLETGAERVPILTHDQPLYGRCRRQQISCILTSEILERR